VEPADTFENLISLLQQLGLRALDSDAWEVSDGYPLHVPLADGGEIVLDLPHPGFIGVLDPEGLGVAVIDGLGYAKNAWGLANRIKFFRSGQSLLETPIGGLVEGSYQGTPGALYLDGFRYFGSSISLEDPAKGAVVLVVNANEERHARRQASKYWRASNALKRLGKALTMNQTVHPLCTAAAHEIASAAELAAVLVWTHAPDENVLRLVASVGANRQGTGALEVLAPTGSPGCAAELVASTRRTLRLPNVAENILTMGLEAKFCYLQPGALSVHPLIISDRLLGVVEFIGRDGDGHFEDNSELFETIAEHLALALHSATLFETFELLASNDPLTGLANHRSMQGFLHQRMAEATRTGQSLAVLMLDVDHFRSYNEEEGHDAGDEVLRLVAEAMRSAIRPYDQASRYGGEEFTVILPGTAMAGAQALAERIRSRVEAIEFMTHSGRVRHVTVSIGVAVAPEATQDPSLLLKAADLALFEAKRGGRNRVVEFDGQLDLVRTDDVFDPASVDGWLCDPELARAGKRLERLDGVMREIGGALNLSSLQENLLVALLKVVSAYEVAGADTERVKQMESAEEFRLLLPSLQALNSRFDGNAPGLHGVKIPLLARVLAVLLALDAEGGKPLVEDPGRFDPEIVAIVANMHKAA
jgi:diguanylate cyclase (GGDEF)-like protein